VDVDVSTAVVAVDVVWSTTVVPAACVDDDSPDVTGGVASFACPVVVGVALLPGF
jgi:hypothetical protein